MPYKEFSPNVLPATDVNTYLMNQSVMVFEDADERDGSLTDPTEGMVVYLKDSNTLSCFDGSSYIPVLLPTGKNLLINGAMQVAQRSTSVSGLGAGFGYRTADRFAFSNGDLGTWTQSIVNDAPNGTRFSRSLRNLCTTAKASPSAGDNVLTVQSIEGQNLQVLRSGTLSAQPVTIDFWVKSNVTGTHIVELFGAANGEQISKAYTISVAGTWEFKSIVFPPNTRTAGVIDNNNLAGLRLNFWHGAGTNFRSGTLTDSWRESMSLNRAVGQVNVAAAVNNYWQVTGAQLTVGSLSLPFEFKTYTEELRECHRYFQRHTQPAMRGVTTTGFTRMALHYGTTMRTSPTLTSNGGTMGFWDGSSSPIGNVGFTFTYSFGNSTCEVDVSSSGWTTGRAACFYSVSTNTFAMDLDAEM